MSYRDQTNCRKAQRRGAGAQILLQQGLPRTHGQAKEITYIANHAVRSQRLIQGAGALAPQITYWEISQNNIT